MIISTFNKEKAQVGWDCDNFTKFRWELQWQYIAPAAAVKLRCQDQTLPTKAKTHFIPIVGGLIGRETMPPFNTNNNKNTGVIFLVRDISADPKEWDKKLFKQRIVKASNNLCKKW